jgi:esterase/lipase
VRHTEEQLRAHRVFFAKDTSGKEDELRQVSPFVLPTPAHCGRPSKGVLLVHGLLDSAFALKDIGLALAKDCHLVYGLLLPGHGTRPADLFRVDKDQWLAAVRFGVRALSTQVDDVNLMGFSLGGALATQITWQEPTVRRLVLMAPALELSYPTLSSMATWYRHISDWVDVDPPYLPVRYQSMPTQAVAQTYALTRQLHQDLERRAITQPVFVLLSADDFIVDAAGILGRFSAHMPHPRSQAWAYGQLPKAPQDPRITQIPVFDAAEKIVNFSHVALTYDPNNPRFGRKGVHRECGRNIGIIARSDVAACEAAQTAWKGEIGTNNSSQTPFERLGYNPHFEAMVAEIRRFLNSAP